MRVWLLVFLSLISGCSAVAAAADKKADLTVAADGSGDVKTIGEAIGRVPENNPKRFVIFIKPGVYKEQIRIPASKPYITLRGESAEKTVLTFNLSSKEAGSTSGSYSVYVGGHDFYAENLTFENSFGTGSQAVAVLTEADRLVFKNCRFLGWQDTLYAKNGRQYFENCYVEGHVDFIFGQAAAVFENCTIHSKGDGYIAAPMRFAADEPAGLVFINSKLTGENIKKGVYLGRPWRAYGRTVFLDTEMGAHIRPEGWNNWGKTENEATAFFAEYNSKGAGAKPEARVKWMQRLSKAQAEKFETENFLKGRDGWNPKRANDSWLEKNPPDYKLISWSRVLDQPASWYAVDEATRIANQIILYQRDNGGWAKNVDMALMLTQAEREKLIREKSLTDTTIDNHATTFQLRYLAKAATAKNNEAHRAAFLKGLDFLLAMQYANGGFPQYFPLRKNYSRHITFNDNAMINVLKLLRDVAKKKEDFLFVDEERRARAAASVGKAVSLILKLQVTLPDGKKTVWAAQYDAETLAPANARSFEPASLTGAESVGIVRFLMLNDEPDQATIDAVEAAVEWYRKNKIEGFRWDRKRTEQGLKYSLVKDAAAPPLWGRFYQIETMKPIFVGRDGVIKYSVSQIEAERGGGYSWFTGEPNELLNKDYPKWLQKIGRKAGNN